MKSTQFVHFRKLAGGGILVSALGLGLLAFGQSRDTYPSAAGGPPDYELSWYTMDGGGVMFSTGGDYELSGTIGQFDAGGTLVGPVESGYELTGGFWFALASGDCNSDAGVNLFDYDAFEACLAGPAGGPLGPQCACFDLDGNGTVDLIDFGLLQSGFDG